MIEIVLSILAKGIMVLVIVGTISLAVMLLVYAFEIGSGKDKSDINITINFRDDERDDEINPPR